MNGELKLLEQARPRWGRSVELPWLLPAQVTWFMIPAKSSQCGSAGMLALMLTFP